MQWRKMALIGIALAIRARGAEGYRDLVVKYAVKPGVLQGSAEWLRMSAVFAPLPPYPPELAARRRGGLVMTEIAVSPAGRVIDLSVLESFDERAARAVASTVLNWRFYTNAELGRLGMAPPCSECLRVNRIGFAFQAGSNSQGWAKRILVEIGFVVGASMLTLGAYHFMSAGTNRQPYSSGKSEVNARLIEISDRPLLLAGKQLLVQSRDITRGGYAVIIVTSPTCPFCLNSVAFHRTLVDAARGAGLRVWLAVPHSCVTSQFLSRSHFGEASVLQWQEFNRRFLGTPSLVLLGPGGWIRRVWLGQLGREEEQQALEALRDPAQVAIPRRRLADGEEILDSVGARSLARSEHATLVSLEERWVFREDHPEGSIDIPGHELGQRADRDLDRRHCNVIDCSGLDDTVCLVTLSRLRNMGFQVAAADFSEARGDRNEAH